MIGLEVTGTIPQLPDDPMRGIMEKISQRMEDSVLMNFMASGRPDQWEPLKSGRDLPLVLTGGLMRSVNSTFGNDFAQVSAKDTIHQKGGIINHPGSNKLQVFMFDGQLIFTHGTKAHKIPIPARPYMLLQDSDLEYIYATIPGAIVSSLIYEPITTH